MEVLSDKRRWRIEGSTLQSRFGRRLLLLFVSLALAPILALAIVAYGSVTRELRAQSDTRLRDQVKTQTMAILERLALLDGELALLARSDSLGSLAVLPPELKEPIAERFRSLALVDQTVSATLHGQPLTPPEPTLDQTLHLGEGRALLLLEAQPKGDVRILMARSVSPDGDLSHGILWSEIDPAYFWWGRFHEDHLPPFTSLWVYDLAGQPLFSSSGEATALDERELSTIRADTLGRTSWTQSEDSRSARFRSISLATTYGFNGLTVVMAEADRAVSAPLSKFRMLILPVFLLTLWVVVLLSLQQIRRNLEPLARLHAGTRDIAKSDFSTRVTVRSGDEFEDLAGSFNLMAERLGRQFESLSALTEVQSSVLSARDRAEIAWAVLSNISRLLPCSSAQLALLDPDGAPSGQIYLWPERREEIISLDAKDLWWLERRRDRSALQGDDQLPHFFEELGIGDPDSVVTLPIVLEDRIVALLSAVGESEAPLAADPGPLHQLADQVALALSKANVIEELESTNRGTLAALARTIDANSRWTLGHSERVAALALRLGTAMGLSRPELDVLERGALLHDIGKLGVSSSILNKPTKLNAEELQEVRRHVEIGSRILEPVPSLRDLLPLIRQHHEWFDGSGYPEGLAGKAIHPLARVLSVVDVYDALRSPRPYRGALSPEEVAGMLRRGSGRQFDPEATEAFLEMLPEILAEEILASEDHRRAEA